MSSFTILRVTLAKLREEWNCSNISPLNQNLIESANEKKRRSCHQCVTSRVWNEIFVSAEHTTRETWNQTHKLSRRDTKPRSLLNFSNQFSLEFYTTRCRISPHHIERVNIKRRHSRHGRPTHNTSQIGHVDKQELVPAPLLKSKQFQQMKIIQFWWHEIYVKQTYIFSRLNRFVKFHNFNLNANVCSSLYRARLIEFPA